jgi:hypothetical protein
MTGLHHLVLHTCPALMQHCLTAAAAIAASVLLRCRGSSGAASSMRDSAASVEAPDGIALGVLLGAGSYGRVYKGEVGGRGGLGKTTSAGYQGHSDPGVGAAAEGVQGEVCGCVAGLMLGVGPERQPACWLGNPREGQQGGR